MFPNLNGYGKYRENQCVLGYVKFSSIDSYRYGSEKLFPKLCGGHTVEDARDYLLQQAISDNELMIMDTVVSPARVPREDDFRIFGDGQTTIKNVYNRLGGTQSFLPYREIFLPNLD
jgi:hypothetical protein